MRPILECSILISFSNLPYLLAKNYSDSLVRTYFDKVYPFAPVINRFDFIRGYQSGDCSLFLLYAVLAPASVHAPADVLSACGFTSRSAAQELFYSKAKLLYNFSAEEDPLLMLQGSIILCMVILDHPTDQDFGYWFHNAVRLATKLDIRNTYVFHSWSMGPATSTAGINCLWNIHRCTREDKFSTVKLYRRIWWALYVCLLVAKFCSSCIMLTVAVVSRYLSCVRQYQTLATTRKYFYDQSENGG